MTFIKLSLIKSGLLLKLGGIKSMTILKKLALLGTGIALTGAMSASAQAQESWIFVFDDSVPAAQAPGLANQAVNRAGGQIGHTYTKTLRGFSAKMSATAAEKLAARNPNIAYYEADSIMRAMPRPPGKGPGGGGGDTTPPPQETPWGIDRVNGGVASNGVACVIDTGIDLDHPDLNVDASQGFSAFTKGKDAGMDDGNGHGTHVAGTIAAIDNSEGVIGVAAGATVVPIKVLGARGSGSNSGVIAGVEHVASTNCTVANMSLGGGFSQALNDAVIAASNQGVVFTVAAGNESQDTNNVSPGSANGPNILTVASMTSSNTFSSFSNWNQPPVDWIAPGSAIKSTWKSGGYNTISGTSMAAPHVAGVVLLGGCSNGGTVAGPDGSYTVCSN